MRKMLFAVFWDSGGGEGEGKSAFSIFLCVRHLPVGRGYFYPLLWACMKSYAMCTCVTAEWDPWDAVGRTQHSSSVACRQQAVHSQSGVLAAGPHTRRRVRRQDAGQECLRRQRSHTRISLPDSSRFFCHSSIVLLFLLSFTCICMICVFFFLFLCVFCCMFLCVLCVYGPSAWNKTDDDDDDDD